MSSFIRLCVTLEAVGWRKSGGLDGGSGGESGERGLRLSAEAKDDHASRITIKIFHAIRHIMYMQACIIISADCSEHFHR